MRIVIQIMPFFKNRARNSIDEINNTKIYRNILKMYQKLAFKIVFYSLSTYKNNNQSHLREEFQSELTKIKINYLKFLSLLEKSKKPNNIREFKVFIQNVKKMFEEIIQEREYLEARSAMLKDLVENRERAVRVLETEKTNLQKQLEELREKMRRPTGYKLRLDFFAYRSFIALEEKDLMEMVGKMLNKKLRRT
jgi:hypothetical protein